MGRRYAGILGLLAMLVVTIRGVLTGAGAEGTLAMAIASLFVFAAVGVIVGSVAESTVDHAIRIRLEKQLAEAELNKKPSEDA